MHMLYNYTQRAKDFAKVNKEDYINRRSHQIRELNQDICITNIIKCGFIFIIISFLNIIHFLSDLTIFCITKNNYNNVINLLFIIFGLFSFTCLNFITCMLIPLTILENII